MRVTQAIIEAEELEDVNDPKAKEAFARVSMFEEGLAQVLSPKDAEGKLARRGAVRAAMKSGNAARAQALVDHFSEEPGADSELKMELQNLLTPEKEESGE